jgi:uncharacterized damage-inducible protein DinB
MFRSIARLMIPVVMVSVSVLASLANAQVSPSLPNPTTAPNPLTTLSIFRSNMQDKIMKSAAAMPESKYSYRPTKDVRSFAELLTHVADISYVLCSNVKGEAPPATATGKSSKTEIMAYLKSACEYCDGVYSGFPDAHLNDPGDFWGVKTNKMFILTQVGNHEALHYGNLVTYLRLRVAGNRHPGQVGICPPQEVRDEEPRLRADLRKEGEGQHDDLTTNGC